MKATLLALACVSSILSEVSDARSYERFEVNYNVTSVDGLGPVIYMSCRFIPLPGGWVELRCVRQWRTHLNLVTSYELLADHGELVDEALTRFTINIEDNNTQVISIHNALKEDSEDGRERNVKFSCQPTYTDGVRTLFSRKFCSKSSR